MDEATLFSLMVDLHREGERQGPGSDDETTRALDLTRLDRNARLNVADIGCGTGASTLVLASKLPHARITAVDRLPEFLEILQQRAVAAGCADRIEVLAASMEALPFAEESFDLIWSEGAIYNMGFRKGVDAWRPLLKPEGMLVVSEITWLRLDPPQQIFAYWNAEYPEIATATEKIAALESAGYDLVGFFVLPASSWIDNYYDPTELRIPGFLARHADEPNAVKVVDMQRHEAQLYRRFGDRFGYGVYVGRKR